MGSTTKGTLMTALILIAIDLVAMAALVFGLYFPRHRRADLSAGLGLGLFGVLSIIRLRSDQISQTEIAYYFASLALGLLTGMSSAVTPLLGGLIALILVALAFGDSKLIFGRYTSQTVQLDRAIADPAELKAALEQRLGASVASVNIVKLDLVNDLTLVDVRSKVA